MDSPLGTVGDTGNSGTDSTIGATLGYVSRVSEDARAFTIAVTSDGELEPVSLPNSSASVSRESF